MSLFDGEPEVLKMLRAPSFRVFSGERVRILKLQSVLFLGAKR